MFDFIEKLRQKPERTKKQIAFFGALLFTGIIFVVWLSVIYPDFKQKKQKEAFVSNLEPSPLGTFKETFVTGASALGEQFGKLKETIYSVSSEFTTPDATTTTPQE